MVSGRRSSTRRDGLKMIEIVGVVACSSTDLLACRVGRICEDGEGRGLRGSTSKVKVPMGIFLGHSPGWPSGP